MKRVYNFISIGIGLFFLYAIYEIIIKGNNLENLPEFIIQIGFFKLFISFLFYMLSHFLRSIRIAVMLERQNFSLINLIAKQYYTNGINLIIPFKLGEFYRIMEFTKLVGDYNTSFMTVIAERAIDFFILFCGLFICLVFVQQQLMELSFTIGLGIAFILAVLFFYNVFPENIKSFNLFLAKRYPTRWAVMTLSKTSRLHKIILNIKSIFRRRYSTIMLLSMMIWSAELLGFYYLTGYLGSFSLWALLAFLVFLSSLIPSGSMGLGALQYAFYLISKLDPGFKYLELSFIYQLFIFLPAIVIGFIIYLWTRFKDQKEISKLLLVKED